MKTAPILVELYGLAPQGKTQRLFRPWLSAAPGPDKKYIVGWAWGLEQSGALPQIGDPAIWSSRVAQEEIALIMGCTRETVTKSLGKLYRFSEACARCDGPGHTFKCACKCHTVHPEWRAESMCKCHGIPRRDCQSEKLKTIAANHPHWQKDSGLAHLPDDEGVRPRDLGVSTPTPSDFPPGEEDAAEPPLPAGRKDGGRRERNHIAPILARNPGFACANAYGLACNEHARPGIGAGSNQVGWLAHTFGADKFSRQAQAEWLEPRQSLEGFRRSRPQWWDPRLPDAWDCECMLGQKKFNFQEVCPKCEGRGFIIGKPNAENDYKGAMPWIGRMILHFLDDRGLDVELRRCKKCDTTFEGSQLCSKCGARGEVLKKRGELNGPGSAKYTMEQIALALGLDESTVYRYFTKFKRLKILRTAPGEVWRKCQRCPQHLPLYAGKCPGCGSTSDPIKRRDAQLIIDLTSRTLDKEAARGERARLQALVKWHRRWLDQKNQRDLEAAVELALKVLGEWECKEHLLLSFFNEMRRRLAASTLRANLVNVLFPLQRE